MAGMGLKPADKYAVPLCHHHHITELHQMTHEQFDAFRGVSLKALSIELAARSPYLQEGRRDT